MENNGNEMEISNENSSHGNDIIYAGVLEFTYEFSKKKKKIIILLSEPQKIMFFFPIG